MVSDMSSQSVSAGKHLKFLALATIIACTWFGFIVFSSNTEVHSSTKPHLHSGTKPQSNTDTPSSTKPPQNSNHGTEIKWPKLPALGISSFKKLVDVLPPNEAQEFGEKRRWNAYKPADNIKRKVYDLMLINTELEWLDIRLGQMADQVDYFVILEADKAFTDAPKALHVLENWDRYKPYHHKMIRHTLRMDGVKFGNTWDRERFSRNAMYEQVFPYLTGNETANQGDVIMVSDVDEILRPDAIKALRNCDFPQKLTLRTKMYYWSFQWGQPTRWDWAHPQATYYDGKNTILPNDLRALNGNGENLYNAGWHCSYCFSTMEETIQKIKTFSHQELNKAENTDRKHMLERARLGKDPFDHEDSIFNRIEENKDVPEFVLAHKEKYMYLLDRDPPGANFQDYKP
jgi:beta-1,4-mannosyl-glycoprotein beta-1,4-N-acetylglucosaminyltransferase